MKGLEVMIRGVLAGLAISIPVGPVNVLCVSRTLSKGRVAGLIAGLGAATADTIYGAIAGFSISFIISFLIREEFWIRLCGGILLIAIGILYYFKKPQALDAGVSDGSSHGDYFSAFLLNLTNPTTVLSFLAVLAVLRLSVERPLVETLLLIAGIFCGGMLWWSTLALMASRFRARFDERGMRWMNRIAGLAIGGFGILTILMSRR